MSLFNSLWFSPWLLAAGTQPIHRSRHFFALTKNCCSSNQNVSFRGNRQRSSFSIDAAVHFHVAPGFSLLDHLTDTPDLLQSCREEMLMPESRIDCHDQHLI